MAAHRKQAGAVSGSPMAVRFDPLRSFVFPNRLRTARREAGFAKLLQFAQRVPEIPYIRLSKIERGEVFARADELARLAGLLGIPAADLLIDVDALDFDLEQWASPFIDTKAVDAEEETFAVMLAAALHRRRATDRTLSVAALGEDYGLPPVIVSRIENATKTLDRWNEHVVQSLCRIFEVRSVGALRRSVEALFASGALDPYLDQVSNPELRREKTSARIAELRAEIGRATPALPQPEATAPPLPAGHELVTVRLLAVLGLPLAEGLVAPLPTGEKVASTLKAGPRAYGLRIGPPTLGGGMPANAVLIVDPDRFPSSGGLAVVTEGGNCRLLTVTIDRHGSMRGYSENPDREVVLDGLDPATVAAVVGAVFD